jgi:hypothetical protein
MRLVGLVNGETHKFASISRSRARADAQEFQVLTLEALRGFQNSLEEFRDVFSLH